MARAINRLSARSVQTMQTPGRHADGGGLYLVVEPAGAKRWVVLYRLAGRRREMGLGNALSVSLARARELAGEARAKIAEGIDPIDARKAPEAHPTKTVPTFGEVADGFMADRESAWRNASHRGQWRQTLEVQCATLWATAVDRIGTDEVLAAIRPFWHAKPETARRIRGRIERILDAAKVQGHRGGENPARWRGHLAMLLPPAKRLARGHHPAMPYEEVPAFFAALAERPGLSARALAFQILTAARPGEVRKTIRSDLDMDAKVWTIPAERMKGNREHRVPLSCVALAILSTIQLDIREPEDIVFTAPRGGMLSDMAFNALMTRMGHADVTAHGFRSSFRDWAAEETDHPREIAEMALAHLVGDETERAYRRGDALAKRRHLLDDWARFVASASGAASTKACRSL